MGRTWSHPETLLQSNSYRGRVAGQTCVTSSMAAVALLLKGTESPES